MNMIETIVSPSSIDFIVKVLIVILKAVVVFAAVMAHVAYATWGERKVIGRMQVRMGPTRVGYFGLLQPIADVVKLFFKEDIIPANSDKAVFYFAPVISLFAALSAAAVVPFFDGFVVADINIGLLFLLAMSSLGAYGLVMAGWASNSKYSFLGGLRASAQVISYEISLGLSLVGVMILAGSLNLSDIVRAQSKFPTGMFMLSPTFLGFCVFCIAALAETNRSPFDLPEAESELVAGYFVDYSSMRFALFFVSEYAGMIAMCSIATLCFLGGWNGPFKIPYVPFAWFVIKMYILIFSYYWVRATLPRYRYDQLMSIGWKILIPLSLVNIVITATYKMFIAR